MITTYQVGLIKEVSQYVSKCSGVYHRKNQFKPWGAKFEIKGFSISLGFFDSELLATKAYEDYHEMYYQEILTQIKNKKDEE
jgi:hypothetical protein